MPSAKVWTENPQIATKTVDRSAMKGAAEATRAAGRSRTISEPRPATGLKPASPVDAQTLAWLQRTAGNLGVLDFLESRGHLQRQVLAPEAPPAAAAPAAPALKLGDGPSVKIGEIQQQLNVVSGAARVPITGRFDAATETAVKAFQKANHFTENGQVDKTTGDKLDQLAPHVVRTKDRTALHPGTPVEFKRLHPTLNNGDAGVAVFELQQRLNSSPIFTPDAIKERKKAGGTITKKLVVDGKFGDKTEAALKLFQHSIPIAQTGKGDPTTWKHLEQRGTATKGRSEFAWTEEVEGVTNVGVTAKYNWKLSAARLLISVGINFKKTNGKPSNHPRVSAWIADIADIWSSYSAVNKAKPKEKTNIDFKAERGTDFDVNVVVDSPANPGRSNSSNWHTGDLRRGLAPHEFGHMLGFADEYNRPDEAYVTTTGEEPTVGSVAGSLADAKTLAQNIKAQLPLSDANGAALATVVYKSTINATQGGYSRLVAAQYRALYGSDVVTDIRLAFAANGITGFDTNKSISVKPFLSSSQSIMGKMTTVSAKRGAKVAEHDHPMQPRHVEPFVDIIRRERGGVWEAKFRS